MAVSVVSLDVLCVCLISVLSCLSEFARGDDNHLCHEWIPPILNISLLFIYDISVEHHLCSVTATNIDPEFTRGFNYHCVTVLNIFIMVLSACHVPRITYK